MNRAPLRSKPLPEAIVHGERQDILSREEIEKQKCGRVVIAYLPAGVSDQLDTPTPITDAVFQSGKRKNISTELIFA